MKLEKSWKWRFRAPVLISNMVKKHKEMNANQTLTNGIGHSQLESSHPSSGKMILHR